MSKVSISKQAKEWQAEEDARTLSNANDIMNDNGRLAAALKKS